MGVDQSLSQLETGKADQQDLATLKTRVDNLTANPGESTEGNAELLDMRVGGGGHYNAVGYRQMALIMATYIDWIMRNNPQEFLEVEFIGTDYSYYD